MSLLLSHQLIGVSQSSAPRSRTKTVGHAPPHTPLHPLGLQRRLDEVVEAATVRPGGLGSKRQGPPQGGLGAAPAACPQHQPRGVPSPQQHTPPLTAGLIFECTCPRELSRSCFLQAWSQKLRSHPPRGYQGPKCIFSDSAGSEDSPSSRTTPAPSRPPPSRSPSG